MKETDKYNDIINKESPIPLKHPRMSIANRAAQFAPFAALTGLDDAMDDTAQSAISDMLESEKGEIFFESP